MRRLEQAWRLGLLAAVALSVLALGVAVRDARRMARESRHLLPVVTASRDLEAGHSLGAEDLRIAAYPAGLIPSGAFRRPDDLLGQTLASAVPRGSALRRSDVLDAPRLQPGERLVTLSAHSLPGGLGRLRAGEHVDILATYEVDGQPVAVLLVADAVVRQVHHPDRSLIGHSERLLGVLDGAGERSATLLVSLEQSLRIAHAVAFGRGLQLVVRPALEIDVPAPGPLWGLP